MQQTLIQNGIDLLIYGMGTVIVFLSLLVAGTQLMSLLVTRLFPPVEEPAPVRAPSQAPAADPHLLAVIQAAIDQHRGRQK